MQQQQQQFPAVLLFFVLISVLLMAQSEESGASVHIVYTQRPEGVEDVEAYHLRTLSTVLGSEGAARESLLYVYKTAANGFSAKLTPAQVEQLSKMPEVLQVMPSQTVKLHVGSGGIH